MIYEGESLLFKLDGSVCGCVHQTKPTTKSCVVWTETSCSVLTLFLDTLFYAYLMHVYMQILQHLKKICLIAAISFWTIFKSLVWITGITHLNSS